MADFYINLGRADFYINLGRIAYNAYCKARNGLTYDGQPIPEWPHLGEGIRGAWVAAARAALTAGLRPGRP